MIINGSFLGSAILLYYALFTRVHKRPEKRVDSLRINVTSRRKKEKKECYMIYIS